MEFFKQRRGNKGFSLVELIIVIAIMVALIAVMGPQYVKYVKQSRDASMTRAAEDVYGFVRTEYADRNLTGTGDIKVEPEEGTGKILIIVGQGIIYEGNEGDGTAEGSASVALAQACGLEDSRTIHSELKYVIRVTDHGGSTSITKDDVTLEQQPGSGG